MNNQGLVCSWVRPTEKILIYVDAEVCNLISETIERLRSLSFLTSELAGRWPPDLDRGSNVCPVPVSSHRCILMSICLVDLLKQHPDCGH